jgi:gamma-glutamyltranspeptidase/glutathione hydrolase
MLLFGFFFFSISSFGELNLSKVKLLGGHTLKQHNSFSNEVMITSQGEYSTRAGLDIIRAGGNIYDAAVAISFVISVERPQSTGLGGGGFLLIDGPSLEKPRALDFREMAPLNSHAKMYLNSNGDEKDKLSLDGILSIGVPGLVDGILTIHEKFGKLSRQEVLAPAIRLADKGFRIYPHLEMSLKHRENVLRKYKASKDIFFSNDKPLKVGDILYQKDLANTLRRIAKYGKKGFYKGKTANAIVTEMRKRNGLITHKDLISYESKWREPVHAKFNEYELFSMSPPSSGGAHIVQIFNILKPFKLNRYYVQSVDVIHKTATAMQLAFVDRAKYMGDSDFVAVPVRGITSKIYANVLRKKITNKALKIKMKDLDSAFPYESTDTTHFTIMDKHGNTISSTQTINYLMGSGLVIPGTGIVMNDEMDDFATRAGAQNVFGAVGGNKNLVAPRKRPLSSMSPTIVRKNGKAFLALGTPSGTRILTCVAQVAFNYLEHKLPLYEAVAATRFHHQWKPDVLQIGRPYFSQTTLKGLERRGHKIKKSNLGCKVQAIAIEKGRLHGVSDPRGEGLALGL